MNELFERLWQLCSFTGMQIIETEAKLKIGPKCWPNQIRISLMHWLFRQPSFLTPALLGWQEKFHKWKSSQQQRCFWASFRGKKLFSFLTMPHITTFSKKKRLRNALSVAQESSIPASKHEAYGMEMQEKVRQTSLTGKCMMHHVMKCAKPLPMSQCYQVNVLHEALWFLDVQDFSSANVTNDSCTQLSHSWQTMLKVFLGGFEGITQVLTLKVKWRMMTNRFCADKFIFFFSCLPQQASCVFHHQCWRSVKTVTVSLLTWVMQAQNDPLTRYSKLKFRLNPGFQISTFLLGILQTNVKWKVSRMTFLRCLHLTASPSKLNCSQFTDCRFIQTHTNWVQQCCQIFAAPKLFLFLTKTFEWDGKKQREHPIEIYFSLPGLQKCVGTMHSKVHWCVVFNMLLQKQPNC